MILFDSGGTLCCDLDYDLLRATQAIMPYVTKNPRSVCADELYKSLCDAHTKIKPARRAGIEISMWTMMRVACGMNGIKLSIDEHTFESVFRNALTPVEITPHIDEFLKYLKFAGIRTGVVSNSRFSGVSLEERLKRILPDNQFEFYISSCDYAVCKPDRTLFEIALTAAGLLAAEVWYCGDSLENDVFGAHSAGIFPVWYDKNGYIQCTKPPDFAFLHIADWHELMELLQIVDVLFCCMVGMF